MPLYYMDPTIEEISLSWSSIENRACLIFLVCRFRYCRGISLLSRQSPEIYRHVMKVLARRLRDTNNAQLVGQFTDIVFDVAAGGGN
jgi:CRP-like cAMP-binding protein